MIIDEVSMSVSAARCKTKARRHTWDGPFDAILVLCVAETRFLSRGNFLVESRKRDQMEA